MNNAMYTCRNPKCDAKTLPGWMLGTNPICPQCGRWLTRQAPQPRKKR